MSVRRLLFALLVAGIVCSAITSYAFAASGRVTNLTAARIPTADFYGFRSIKHAPLTSALYATMKEETGAPRLPAVACWSPTDCPSVAGIDAVPENGVSVMGFFTGTQPRWLHLSPQACDEIQRVIDGEPLTGARAGGLVVAVHQTLHAYGVEKEAQANCYAGRSPRCWPRTWVSIPARSDTWPNSPATTRG